MTATVDKRAYQQLTAHLTAALRRIAELEATLELERGCHIRTERKLQDALKQSSQRLRELSLEYSSGPSGAAADAVWGNGQLVQHLQRLQPVAAAKSPTHRAGFSRPTATLDANEPSASFDSSCTDDAVAFRLEELQARPLPSAANLGEATPHQCWYALDLNGDGVLTEEELVAGLSS